MSNSTHKAEVFRIQDIQKHPNADLLSIVTIFGGYKCIVRTSEFQRGDLAVFVTPDSVMPDKPEYAFLKGHLRIKAQKIRKYMSQGLILKAPPGSKEGDDVAELLGITHYVPQEPGFSRNRTRQGLTSVKPPMDAPKYDIDTFYRYHEIIPEGTAVALTEKLHGTSARYSWQDGKMWAGSRNLWRKRDQANSEPWKRLINKLSFGRFFPLGKERCDYWRVVDENPEIEQFCKDNPGKILYGEIFGDVQDLKYGSKPGQLFFRAFDVYYPQTRDFMPSAEFFEKMKQYSVPVVPIVCVCDYSREEIEKHISGKSLIPTADHLREGVVIKPLLFENNDTRIGRMVLKAVSPEYLERAK